MCYLYFLTLLALLYSFLFYFYFYFFNTRLSKYNKVEVLEKAEKDLAAVTNQYVSRLVKELQGTDFWKLRRAYSPGVYFATAASLFELKYFYLILVMRVCRYRSMLKQLHSAVSVKTELF